MTTVKSEVIDPIVTLKNEVDTLVSRLVNPVARMPSSSMMQNEIRHMEASAKAHDSLFEEAESKAQGKGKKTRRQTLQEFVLLFFFCSYALFTAAVCLYIYLQKGISEVFKVLGIMIIIALVIAGLIIRLA